VLGGFPPCIRTFDPSDLDEVITRVEDCGQLVQVQRQLFSGYPQYFVLTGDRPYDEVDALAADVCSTIRRRGDRFTSVDQLRFWLGVYACRAIMQVVDSAAALD
jgi:hypothetical protein